MSLFDLILQNASYGKLVTSFCVNCNKYMWPPNYICNCCNSKTSLRKIKRVGILLEKTQSNILGREGTFGIGEFGGIRLIGTIKEDVRIGEVIRIHEIGIKNGRLDIKFTILSS